MNQKIYVTTSIPYVNAAPHVGHAQEFIVADAIARLYRLAGQSVVFQTGTDENAFKNVVSASAQGVDPLKFVTDNAERFRKLADQLHISYDVFIRTTDEKHTKGVQLFWKSLNAEDLYQKSYRGLYCQGCEDFFQEKDLKNGLCPDHKSAPLPIEEDNTFFRLSKYQEELETFISRDAIRIVPEFRKNEVLSFIRQGLQDISITRDAKRAGGWGVKVPGSENQVVYVWIDALINYLSGQGFGTSSEWTKTWNPETKKIHVIGKNVWKFHAVYWPALLLSAGLPLPNEIIVHGFLTANGQKISKSLGNAIDPASIADDLGADTLRHDVLSYLSLYHDADFSSEQIRHVYNTDFANTLGNLVSRLASLARKASVDLIANETADHSKVLREALTNYDLQNLSQKLWADLSKINAEINDKKPWELLKVENHDGAKRLLQQWNRELRKVIEVLSCYIPIVGGTLLKLCENGLHKQVTPLLPRLIEDK